MYSILSTTQTACCPLMTSCSFPFDMLFSFTISIYAYKNIGGGRLGQSVTCPRLYRLLEVS